jgi:predicted restriction endonuclease
MANWLQYCIKAIAGEGKTIVSESNKLWLADSLSNQQQIDEGELELMTGEEKDRMIKARVNQSFFRSTILASYNKCCVTGKSNSELLIASHIVAWARDRKDRLNPRNGILINALHDKAFEYGYITICIANKILVYDELLRSKDSANEGYFKRIHNQDLFYLQGFYPILSLLNTITKKGLGISRPDAKWFAQMHCGGFEGEVKCRLGCGFGYSRNSLDYDRSYN